MRLFFGPDDILNAAESVRGGVSGAVNDLSGVLDLISRAGDLLERGEKLMARAEALAAKSDVTLDQAQGMLSRTGDAMTRVETMLTQGEEMLAPLQTLSEEALPIATRVADSINEDEVQAVMDTINHLPQLVEHLEEDIMPLLGQLDRVGPDVHAILETTRDLNHAIKGIPGMRLFSRRGQQVVASEEQAQEEQAHTPRAIES